MSSTINPRTYGLTLWTAFSNRYPGADEWARSQNHLIREGFVRAVDQNIGTVIDKSSLAAFEPQVIDAISAEFPPEHTFPVEAFDALNEAYMATQDLYDLDVTPISSAFGPGWSNAELFAEMWAWAKNPGLIIPEDILTSDAPVDRFIQATNNGRILSRPLLLGTSGEVKRRMALILAEKVRVGWDGDTPDSIVGKCFRCLVSRPLSARIEVDDIVKVVRVSSTSIYVQKWDVASLAWTDNSGAPWMVSREHLSLTPVDDPEVTGSPLREGDLIRITTERANSADVRVGETAIVETVNYTPSTGMVRDVYATMQPGTTRAGVRYYFTVANFTVAKPEGTAEPVKAEVARPFVVGDRVRVVVAQPDGTNRRLGDTGTIVTDDGGDLTSGIPFRVNFYNTNGLVSHSWLNATSIEKIVEDEPVDDGPEENPELVALRSEVATLRAWKASALSDIEKSSAILIAQANRRSWCSEYDEIIDECNGEMNVLRFEDREQEHEVEVNWTATISGSTTVTVTARSLEDAEEQVRNSPSDFVDIDSYALGEAARYNGADDIEFEIA